jgi:hypothetical protein
VIDPCSSDFQASDNCRLATGALRPASPLKLFSIVNSTLVAWAFNWGFRTETPRRIQMAADSTEPQPAGAPAADGVTAGTSAEPPKKYPKGVILGKDGKP